MLTLYHMPVAICAQKVRVCLAEKGVECESRLMTGQLRTAEYLKLNPAGYVPTLVHDDAVLTESRIINEYLEEAFDGPALMPTRPLERAQVALWTKQIDDTLHLNVFTLSLAVGRLPHFLAMDAAALQLNLPFDITKRERAFDIIEKRMNSRFVAVALERFRQLADDMDAALSRTAWLAGDAYTLADVDYAPYVQRMEDIGLAFLWEDRPNLRRWIDAVRARPSYDEIIERWTPAQARTGDADIKAHGEAEFRARLQGG